MYEYIKKITCFVCHVMPAFVRACVPQCARVTACLAVRVCVPDRSPARLYISCCDLQHISRVYK